MFNGETKTYPSICSINWERYNHLFKTYPLRILISALPLCNFRKKMQHRKIPNARLYILWEMICEVCKYLFAADFKDWMLTLLKIFCLLNKAQHHLNNYNAIHWIKVSIVRRVCAPVALTYFWITWARSTACGPVWFGCSTWRIWKGAHELGMKCHRSYSQMMCTCASKSLLCWMWINKCTVMQQQVDKATSASNERTDAIELRKNKPTWTFIYSVSSYILYDLGRFSRTWTWAVCLWSTSVPSC